MRSVMCISYCLHEILITNPIDWLFAACLEYFIFFSINSSEARKQYDYYCLSIMQTAKNWFAESRFFVGVRWMEFVSHVKFRQLQTQR
jgi:hypothetical protein